MSRLIALIDEHRAKQGDRSEASIAREIGVAPQTINSWRNRGMKKLPRAKTMRALAAALHIDEAVVLYAAGVDVGYIVEHPETGEVLDIAVGLESGDLAARTDDTASDE